MRFCVLPKMLKKKLFTLHNDLVCFDEIKCDLFFEFLWISPKFPRIIFLQLFILINAVKSMSISLSKDEISLTAVQFISRLLICIPQSSLSAKLNLHDSSLIDGLLSCLSDNTLLLLAFTSNILQVQQNVRI